MNNLKNTEETHGKFVFLYLTDLYCVFTWSQNCLRVKNFKGKRDNRNMNS